MADNLLFLAKSDKATAMAQHDTVPQCCTFGASGNVRNFDLLKMLVLFWVISFA